MDFTVVFDAVLHRVEQGADPFAALRAEGVPFAAFYADCRARIAPGYHPWACLLDARAEWLSVRAHACYDRLAERVDRGLVRHRDIAEVERKAITCLATEARALRDRAGDLRLYGTLTAGVMAGLETVGRARVEARAARPRRKRRPAK